MINVKDYVVLTETVSDLAENSVGFVKEVTLPKATVLFIGKQKEGEIELSKLKFLDTSKTGRPKGTETEYETKICNVCHILKPIEEFDINQNAKAGQTRRPSCKECRKIIDGASLKTSEKKRMEAKEAEIVQEGYFICPICKKVSIPNVTASLVIDHDHETGNARDLICDSCNTGLGRFKDNPELLKEAISYLKQYENED